MKRNATFLAALVTAASAFSQGADYDRGVALFNQGKPAEAVPYLQRATASHPEDARTWKALGVTYAAEGDYKMAEPPLKRACALDPRSADACYFEARALYALDRFEASLDALAHAAAVTPDSWRVHLGMAQADEAIGRAAEAEKEYRSAAALAHNIDPRPDAAYGLFLIRQGRQGDAIPLLQQTVTRFPDSAEAHIYLGRAILERGDAAGAIVQLERAVALDSNSAQAHLLLAKAYVQAGKTAEAQPHFDAARRLEATRRK